MLAFTHVPSPNLDHGQRTHVARVAIDHALAGKQHQQYCQMLGACGAQVETLDINRELPDATFIEDTAILLDEVAVLASMGTEARRRELAGVERVLQSSRELHRVDASAPLEGGDVLRVGRILLVGLTSRTSLAGAQALAAIVERHGYWVRPVPVRGCLHLKTACTALPDGRLLVNPAWVDGQALQGYHTVPIPPDEPWGANTLLLGSWVCLASEHQRTADLLNQLGFDVQSTPLSEFAKAEGGVSCLSLLETAPRWATQ
jgi:dimethylargininase